MEAVDILTIAAHPDDIELTCSGTLFQRMLDPNGRLQGVTPVRVCARTCA